MAEAPDVDTTLREITSRLNAAAAAFVPWFREQMPAPYFEDIDPASQQEHMGAILAVRAAGQEPRLRIRSTDGRRVTYVLTQDAPGTLTHLMREFGEAPLRTAKIFSSKDKQLVIDIFDVGVSPPCDRADPQVEAKFEATLAMRAEHARSARAKGPWTDAELAAHFGALTEDYVRECSPIRILLNADLAREAQRSGGAVVVLEEASSDRSRINFAASGMTGRSMLERIANRLGTLQVNITRAYVDTITPPGEEPVLIISAVVTSPDGNRIDPDSALWKGLRRDLLRLKWLEVTTTDLAYRAPGLGLGGADVLYCYADLAHQILVKANRYLYSRSHIREIAVERLSLSQQLVQLFWDRFEPSQALDSEAYERRAEALRQEISATIDDEVATTVLTTILDAITATLKTNYFVDNRYALALRLSPEPIFKHSPRPEIPYGVFWVHGRGFNAFHIRFRSTSRGGVRVVRPASNEQHVRESERHLDEVYDLAYAQQLKNKDIPEGGAKAVILVSPGHDVTPAVRAFAEALLDLLTNDAATEGRIVDRYGLEERLYFGPDENITPEHINWIVARAKARSYPFPNALMSSKPGAGINHKEYGVTSEGVNVFLEACLKAIGIDPRAQPFSLKLTGGPDGDVAGNAIRIAIREFGAHVRIVGIADGFGCAEDPDGLDHEELLRLVRESASIISFNVDKLSAKGRLARATDPEGTRLRNEMHNRVVSDAFVPAGGRPQTINGSNWSRFLREDGTPSSRLIVEGANLFITGEARQKLFEAGVLIVKDSSANKCGVICSSYEVMGSMLLSEEEFLTHKAVYVEQVLERLRRAARLEAEQLLEARRRWPRTPLFELSIQLSREINRLTDAIAGDYERLCQVDPEIVRETVLSHAPPVLREVAGDRLFSVLPDTYRAQIVCTGIACGITYREGLDYLRDTPDADLAAFALDYVRRERRNRALVAEVRASSLPHAQEIAAVLQVGGTRAGLRGVG